MLRMIYADVQSFSGLGLENGHLELLALLYWLGFSRNAFELSVDRAVATRSFMASVCRGICGSAFETCSWIMVGRT